jgi:hypothetical protein
MSSLQQFLPVSITEGNEKAILFFLTGILLCCLAATKKTTTTLFHRKIQE